MFLVATVTKEDAQVASFQTFKHHTMAVSCMHQLAKRYGVKTELEDFMYNDSPCNVYVDAGEFMISLIVEGEFDYSILLDEEVTHGS